MNEMYTHIVYTVEAVFVVVNYIVCPILGYFAEIKTPELLFYKD